MNRAGCSTEPCAPGAHHCAGAPKTFALRAAAAKARALAHVPTVLLRRSARHALPCWRTIAASSMRPRGPGSVVGGFQEYGAIRHSGGACALQSARRALARAPAFWACCEHVAARPWKYWDLPAVLLCIAWPRIVWRRVLCLPSVSCNGCHDSPRKLGLRAATVRKWL